MTVKNEQEMTQEQPARMFDPARYLMQIDGREYLEVKWRLVWLRTEHPTARISTRLVKHEDGFAQYGQHAAAFPDQHSFIINLHAGRGSFDVAEVCRAFHSIRRAVKQQRIQEWRGRRAVGQAANRADRAREQVILRGHVASLEVLQAEVERFGMSKIDVNAAAISEGSEPHPFRGPIIVSLH